MVKEAMASSIQLILGGARSGKSSFALAQGNEKDFDPRVFLATASAGDEEMRDRIQRHRSQRDGSWTTVEEPYRLTETLIRTATQEKGLVVVDCVTLWISNLFCGMGGKALTVLEAETQVDLFFRSLSSLKGHLRIVSNEVGLGIVPEHPLGRQFRDLQGFFNQRMAKTSQEVFLITAGIAQKLK
jgi:adenosylcobinamide kinase/adenosylcobinamide-phosphate guanylyltransferase